MTRKYITYVNGVIWNCTKNKRNAMRFEARVLAKYPHFKNCIETETYDELEQKNGKETQ